MCDGGPPLGWAWRSEAGGAAAAQAAAAEGLVHAGPRQQAAGPRAERAAGHQGGAPRAGGLSRVCGGGGRAGHPGAAPRPFRTASVRAATEEAALTSWVPGAPEAAGLVVIAVQGCWQQYPTQCLSSDSACEGWGWGGDLPDGHMHPKHPAWAAALSVARGGACVRSCGHVIQGELRTPSCPPKGPGEAVTQGRHTVPRVSQSGWLPFRYHAGLLAMRAGLVAGAACYAGKVCLAAILNELTAN